LSDLIIGISCLRLKGERLRLDAWQNAPVQFASPEAEANYKERIGRLRKIYDMEPHDRPLPIFSWAPTSLSCAAKGFKAKTWFITMRNCVNPLLEFHNEFQPIHRRNHRCPILAR
jgi:hypothetical protein